MLKQGLVQESIADINNPHLPPLNNLPQWSRVSSLDRARYPKPFRKDRLQPLPNPGETAPQDTDDPDADTPEEPSGSSTVRIEHLERSMLFIQQQHQEMLKSLHTELDNLKRENKDLQFQVLVLPRSESAGPGKPSSSSSHRVKATPPQSGGRLRTLQKLDKLPAKSQQPGAHPPKPPSAKKFLIQQDSKDSTEAPTDLIQEPQSSGVSEDQEVNVKLVNLEEELTEVQRLLEAERSRNLVLADMLEKAQENINSSAVEESVSANSKVMSAPLATQSSHQLEPQQSRSLSNSAAGGATGQQEVVLPYGATLNPLLVNIAPNPPRPPTLNECETIIRHLVRKNERTSHELSQLKYDLRDVLYSHKWTPDAFLLAKAYVIQDEARETAVKDQLPKIPLTQQHRRIPDSAYLIREQALPALKQTLGNKAIERQRRTQLIQRSRKTREVLQ